MLHILQFLLLTNLLYADIKYDMNDFYKNDNFTKACNIGLKNLSHHKNDENYISLYAFSCLKADFIDRLAFPITKLKLSKEARQNSAYFSIILMQKKLLYYALIDGYDLTSFNFPSTNHVISKVFDAYSALKKDDIKSFYIFQDKNDKLLKYKLYLLKSKGLNKIIIEEIYNNKIIKKHKYW